MNSLYAQRARTDHHHMIWWPEQETHESERERDREQEQANE